MVAPDTSAPRTVTFIVSTCDILLVPQTYFNLNCKNCDKNVIMFSFCSLFHNLQILIKIIRG